MVRVNHSPCAHGETRDGHPPIVMERLERRMLLTTVHAWQDTSISDMGGYCMTSAVRFGSNGWEGPGAVHGMVVGSAAGDVAGALVSWDSNPFDGLDSGWNDIRFEARVAGTDQILWTVGEFDSLSPYTNLCDGIGSVAIRAGVLGWGMGMNWRDVVVQFKRDGQLMESVFVGAVSVDRRLAFDNDPAESVVVVTPSANDYDEVIITGSVKLLGNLGLWPGSYDIFGEIFIYASPFERPLGGTQGDPLA